MPSRGEGLPARILARRKEGAGRVLKYGKMLNTVLETPTVFWFFFAAKKEYPRAEETSDHHTTTKAVRCCITTLPSPLSDSLPRREDTLPPSDHLPHSSYEETGKRGTPFAALKKDHLPF
jgi:hypothetical protein